MIIAEDARHVSRGHGLDPLVYNLSTLVAVRNAPWDKNHVQQAVDTLVNHLRKRDSESYGYLTTHEEKYMTVLLEGSSKH
jgi:formylmethanofuran dehydrogenase subunit E-like metal-binding protein